MTIIHKDLSGAQEGGQKALGILAQALEKRAEGRLKETEKLEKARAFGATMGAIEEHYKDSDIGSLAKVLKESNADPESSMELMKDLIKQQSKPEQKPFMTKEINKMNLGHLNSSFSAAQSAKQLLSRLPEAEKAINSGDIAGPGAWDAISRGRLATGMREPTESEAMLDQLGNEAVLSMNEMKNMKGPMTNRKMAAIQKVKVGVGKSVAQNMQALESMREIIQWPIAMHAAMAEMVKADQNIFDDPSMVFMVEKRAQELIDQGLFKEEVGEEEKQKMLTDIFGG